MRNLFNILFLVLFLCASVAGTNISVETISVLQGLPNPHVTKVFFDQKGLMWVGTVNGLCAYDGYNFLVRQSSHLSTRALTDDHILYIKQDKNENYWLLTHSGLELLYKGDLSSRLIKPLPDYSEVVNVITSPESNYVFLVYKNKIEKYNIYSFREDTGKTKLEHEVSSAVFSMGYIYLAGNNYFVRFNLQTGIIEKLAYGSEKLSNSDRVLLAAYKSKHLIVAVKNKLYLYDINHQACRLVETFPADIVNISSQVGNSIALTTKLSVYHLSFVNNFDSVQTKLVFDSGSYMFNAVELDGNQLIWVGTNMGLVKINPFSLYIHHSPPQKFGFNEKYLKNLVTCAFGNGYIARVAPVEYTYTNLKDRFSGSFTLGHVPTSCAWANNKMYVGTNKGLFVLAADNKNPEKVAFFSGDTVHSLKLFNNQLWVATVNGLYVKTDMGFQRICKVEAKGFIAGNSEVVFYNKEGLGVLIADSCKVDMVQSEAFKIHKINDLFQSLDGRIWVAAEDGLYCYSMNTDKELKNMFVQVFSGPVYSLLEAKNIPEIWFSSDKGICSYNYQSGRLSVFAYEDGIRSTSFIVRGAFHGSYGDINFIALNEIVHFYPDSIYRQDAPPKIILSLIKQAFSDSVAEKLFPVPDSVIISPSTRLTELHFTTLDYFAPEHNRFEYSLTKRNQEAEWKNLQKNIVYIGDMSPGSYELKVRVKNSHGVESEEYKVIIRLNAPMLQTKLAYIGYLVVLVFSIFMIIRLRTRNLTRMNREYKEKERIAKKIEQQKEELSVKNKNITDSINYARRIQLAMMPSIKHFKAYFPDSFILHMPKDIVSGDFYWSNRVGNKLFFSAIDCTGHGVPGAFMSIIGVELFRRITEVEKIYEPAEILNSLSKNFERVFGDVDEMKLRDGMDLAFCAINEENTLLEFSGAFNPLYIIRNSSIIEIKGDRKSVGIYYDDDEVHSFSNHIIPLMDNDLVYIFTDGYVDQFGGPEGKKYKFRRFRHLLLALHQLPMEKQEEFLRKSILEWKGEIDQVDDILVMGIRIHQKTKQ
ncbi:MAG: SpoIIE family protein phosphatase [Bacteroidales bacterium]|nr:SpoIIE family protein phosphatase [Bacteroidales bacterium]